MNVPAQQTILIIDDNPSNLKLLHQLLTENNYRVRVADSAALGLESALSTPPDIILLDIQMPEMDGYQVCVQLQQAPSTSNIPVIFISASSDTITVVKALEMGARDYIQKPFNANEVLARIQNHLELSRLQKQSQNMLSTSQYMLLSIMDNSPFIIYIKNEHGEYIRVNKEFEKLTGINQQQAQDKTDQQLFPDNQQKVTFFSKYDQYILNVGSHKEFEDVISFQGQKNYYLSVKFPLKDVHDENYAVCGICSDITLRKKAENELEHLATYDTLTGLPNRSFFYELLSLTLASSDRDTRKHALLFIDLDNFKNINDSLGHHAGDLLLKQVSQRLKKCVRVSDTVCRLGGDEFVLILQRIHRPEEAANVSSKIIDALSGPYLIEGTTVFITPSIGIVLSPDNGSDVEMLIRNADTAMYHAKRQGRNTFQFFTEEMNQYAQQRMEIEKELRIAIEQQAIVPYFQPKVDSHSGKIIGFEALARWHHHQLGEIGPFTFIPIAEEVNLVQPLDELILEKCIQLFAPLIHKGLFTGTVAINLSAQHFYRETKLLDFIDSMLNKYDFPAKNLEIEITEESLMKNIDDAILIMSELKKMGIKLTIDDFGTGYSSLSYLKEFPVQALKIDMYFTRDINKGERENNLVRSIISLAQGLNLSCIAEGVETTEQAKCLMEYDCHTFQGFLFSQAITFEAAKKLVVSNKTYSITYVPSADELSQRS
jgi:diguanylate cyclase (GGDEF)-like protein/PAS domain S-box-containing protein